MFVLKIEQKSIFYEIEMLLLVEVYFDLLDWLEEIGEELAVELFYCQFVLVFV